MIKNFEKLDYLTILKNQKELNDKLNQIDDSESPKYKGGEYLSLLEKESQKALQMQRIIEERKELTHVIIQAIIFSEKGKEGFVDFKENLKNLLNNYPLNKLPKSGIDILFNK
jgi:hypothetical protein